MFPLLNTLSLSLCLTLHVPFMSTEGISHCLSLLSLLELRNPRSPSSPFLSGTDEAAYAVYSRPPTKSTYASALVEAGWLACLILCPRGRLPSFLARVSAFASCFPTSTAAVATGDEGWSSLSAHAHYSLSAHVSSVLFSHSRSPSDAPCVSPAGVPSGISGAFAFDPKSCIY